VDIIRPRRGRFNAGPLGVIAGATAVVALGAYGTTVLLHPHTIVPSIERASVVTDVVRRGTLVRTVAAPGAFVPARVAVVAAPSDGLVAAVFVRPGTHVAAGTPIARLRNPDLEAALADLDAQIAAANAQASAIAEEARAATLQHRTAERAARSEREESSTQLAVDQSLHDQGLIGDLQYRLAGIKAASASDRQRIESSGVAVSEAGGTAKLAAQRAVIAGLVARRVAKIAQIAALDLVGGQSGVVQSVNALSGARVLAGAELVRVASDDDLEAVLQVAENDARVVVPGLRVRLDVGAQSTEGIVTRIEPAAQNGTVPVHVQIVRRSLAARPQMHVEGAIELGRVAAAISIARPAGSVDGATVDLYRLEPGGRSALRTRVGLGLGPADRVQVRSGLAPGDIVIVSDTAAAGEAARINLR
jgi:HlyD family secretion protein